MDKWLINLIILTAVYGLLFLKNKRAMPRKLKALTNYYETKRKEFTWLDEWLKKNPNTPQERVKSERSTSILLFAVYYAGVALVIIIFKKWTFVHFLLIAGTAIFFLIAEWLKKDANTSLDTSFDIECPSCHCPHAWVMIREEKRGSGSSTSTSTTVSGTRSTDGGIVGAGMDSFYSNFDKTKTTTKTTYYYEVIQDFKCLNCGHTEQDVRNTDSSYPPNYGVEIFNPPKPAWEPVGKNKDSNTAPPQTGKGTFNYTDGEYEGEFANGKHHGKGKFTYLNGDTYEGDWVKGNRTGKGKYIGINGESYDGEWLNGYYHGQGKMIYSNGVIEEGRFDNGNFVG